MNHRRRLIVALAAGALVGPGSASGQQPKKIARIGLLTGGTPASTARSIQAFRDGLRELGRVEGQNITIEYRYAHGRGRDLFPTLADELVRLTPDCILTGGLGAINALMRLTKKIPIVIANIDTDPVREGIFKTLARPGGNVTGLIGIQWELAGKRLDLLREIVPKARRVAVLFDPRSRSGHSHAEVSRAAAGRMGMQLQLLEARGSEEIEQAFRAARNGGADAISVIHIGVMGTQRPLIVKLAMDARLPAIYSSLDFVLDGGLMAYAPDTVDQWRRAAMFVEKILKGGNPADIPVEQPTKFELAINMKIVKALGIRIPQSILLQATKVIE